MKIRLNDPELQNKANARCEEIIRNKQSNGRIREKILKHCLYGIAAEMAVLDKFGGTLITQNFDKTNPNSYAYDHVFESGLTNEIKTTFKIDPFINFNLKSFYDSDKHGSYCDLSTTFNNINLIDIITFVSQTIESEEINSVIRCVVDAKEFKSNSRSSRPTYNGSTHYVITNQLKKITRF